MSATVFVVAIDGPGGAGKSTTARAVAARLGLSYLDTGALYRCVALRAVEQGLGLGCVSSIAVAEEFRLGRLTQCEVPGRDFSRQFHFVLHKHKHRSAGLTRWLALCKDV